MIKDRNFKLEAVFVAVMLALITFFIVGFINDFSGDQSNVFFSKTSNYMADFYNPCKYAVENNPYGFGKQNSASSEQPYLPLSYILFYYLGKTADYLHLDAFSAGKSTIGLATSFIFMFLVSAVFYLILYDNYKGKKFFKFLIPTILFLSSIFLFSCERGNLIILATAFTSFFVFNYKSENKFVREFSYICLAIAVALKVYPALLGILLLFDKKYKDAIRLIIYGLIFTFLPFAFLEGGFNNIPLWLDNLPLNSNVYEHKPFERFNFRFWASRIEDFDFQTTIYNIFSVIDVIIAAVAVIMSYFHKVHWKRIFQLLLVIIILPVNSAEYSGLYLFIGIVLFFSETEHKKIDWLYLLLFIFVLNPYQFILHQNNDKIINLTNYAMNISASLMLIVLTVESVFCCCKKVKLFKSNGPKHLHL